MSGMDGEVSGRLTVEKTLKLYMAVREYMRDENSEERRQAVDDAVDDLQGLLLLISDFSGQALRLARVGRSLNKIMTRGGKDAKSDTAS
jgi:hypothetical protein